MRLTAANSKKIHFFTLLPILLGLVACTETIPVKRFEEQKLITGYINCKLELGAYFNKKYGLNNIGDRAVAKLQFTIPEEAFTNRKNDSKKWNYKLATEADNRVIFFVNGSVQAGALLTSVQFRDNTKNDSVEFNVASASGRIGYVEQNNDSLFVRLADSTGNVLSDVSVESDKDRNWNGFIDEKQSEILLTDDSYRKRSIQTEALTIDEINKNCD